MRRLALVAFILLNSMLGGCSGKFTDDVFVRQDVDFDSITRVAVLPFQNNTTDNFAHQRIRNVAITQLLASGMADVVDRGIVDSVLYEEVIDPTLPIDLINMKRLGQRLNVQAFLLGSVDMVAGKGSGTSYPQLALTLRLVETQSASILWQNSGHWTSESFTGKIFGIAPTDSYHVNIELLNKMMRSLPTSR